MKSLPYQNDVETHRPVLTAVVGFLRNLKPNLKVVEIGAGFGSTPHLLSLLNQERDSLISIESNPEWLQKLMVRFPASDRHHWVFPGDSWYHCIRQAADLLTEMDLLFIDSSPWDSRTISLDFLSPKSMITVIHDVDYFPREGIWGKETAPLISRDNVGVRDYSDIFKFWCEIFPNTFFAPTGPPTLVGSNQKSEIENLVCEECFISCSSRSP
jgi:hypothetical protein